MQVVPGYVLEFLPSVFILIDKLYSLFDFIQIFRLVFLDLFNYRFQMSCARPLNITTQSVFRIIILFFLKPILMGVFAHLYSFLQVFEGVFFLRLCLFQPLKHLSLDVF